MHETGKCASTNQCGPMGCYDSTEDSAESCSVNNGRLLTAPLLVWWTKGEEGEKEAQHRLFSSAVWPVYIGAISLF
ncbi:MAG: hypothetical protein ACXV5I_08780 [Halobacteriota archaeon]